MEWTFVASAGDRELSTVSNERTAALGLGPGCRESVDDPPWHVEIAGGPSIVATIGWPEGAPPGKSTQLLNFARAMNTHPASGRRGRGACRCSTSLPWWRATASHRAELNRSARS